MKKIFIRSEDAIYEMVDNEFVCTHNETTADHDHDIYVCDTCDEIADGSPGQDRADIYADMYADSWSGR